MAQITNRPPVLATGSFDVRQRVLHTVLLESFRPEERAEAAALLAADVIGAGSLENWSAWMLYIAESLDEHFADAAESALREMRDAIDRRLETGAWS